MATRSIRNLMMVAVTLVLVGACSSKSHSPGKGEGGAATGKVVAVGAFDFSSQRLGLRTRIAKEPFQDTFALRLAFEGGEGRYRGLLVDIDDLPAGVAGQYSFGDGVDADLNFLAADPNESGSRFSIREGQLEIRVSDGRASGTMQGVAEAAGFTASDEVLEVTLDFEEVLIDESES